jgi:CRP/FNR family cyclic AMP-dependent transcriptional regulator
MDVSEIDRQTQFLRGIPVQFHSSILELAQVRTYSPGSDVFTEGSLHSDFHLVMQGHIRLDMTIPKRGRVPLLTVGPGDTLAWSALLSDGTMTTSAIALESVQTAAFAGKELQQLCERQPEVGYYVMKQLAGSLSRRLLATRLQLLDLFAGHEPSQLTGA